MCEKTKLSLVLAAKEMKHQNFHFWLVGFPLSTLQIALPFQASDCIERLVAKCLVGRILIPILLLDH